MVFMALYILKYMQLKDNFQCLPSTNPRARGSIESNGKGGKPPYTVRRFDAEGIAAISNAALMAANTKLGEENHELKEEVEELHVMMEILKGRGLVSEGRTVK